MKQLIILVVALLLISACVAEKKIINKSKYSPLMFKRGEVRFNLDSPLIADKNTRVILDEITSKTKRHMLLQFQNLPTDPIKSRLEKNGISILEYMPQNAYWVSISKAGVHYIEKNLLKTGGKSGYFFWSPPSRFKYSKQIEKEVYPDYVIEGSNISLQILLHSDVSHFDAVKALNKKFLGSRKKWIDKNLIQIQINKSQIKELAAMDVVKHIEVAPPANVVDIISVQID